MVHVFPEASAASGETLRDFRWNIELYFWRENKSVQATDGKQFWAFSQSGELKTFTTVLVFWTKCVLNF